MSRYLTIHSPIARITAETVRQIKRDDVTLMSAGVAYYVVLSIFPLTLLLLSIMRLFADAPTSRKNLENFFAVYLPDSVGFVDQISGQGTSVTGVAGVLGLVALLWSGTAMISALTRAVNRAFGIHDDLPFYKDRPLSALLGIGIIFAFGASLFSSAAIESVARFDVPVIGRLVWVQVFARFIPFLVTVASFSLVYLLLPRVRPPTGLAVQSAVVGAVLFELAKVLFLFYLNRVASFEVYGGMTLLVLLMIWSYFSAFVVLVGAELVAVRRQMASLDCE